MSSFYEGSYAKSAEAVEFTLVYWRSLESLSVIRSAHVFSPSHVHCASPRIRKHYVVAVSRRFYNVHSPPTWTLIDLLLESLVPIMNDFLVNTMLPGGRCADLYVCTSISTCFIFSLYLHNTRVAGFTPRSYFIWPWGIRHYLRALLQT